MPLAPSRSAWQAAANVRLAPPAAGSIMRHSIPCSRPRAEPSATSLAAQPVPASPLRAVGQGRRRRRVPASWRASPSVRVLVAQRFCAPRVCSLSAGRRHRVDGRHRSTGLSDRKCDQPYWEYLHLRLRIYVADTGNNGNALTDLALRVRSRSAKRIGHRIRLIAYAIRPEGIPPRAARNF